MRQLIKCAECGKKSKKLVVARYQTDAKHDGLSYSIDIPDLRIYKCQTETCESSPTLPDESELRIADEIRRQANLLSPSLIRLQRENLRFSQKEFADELGFAAATVSRWETGAQIQQKHCDLAMRQFFNHPLARRLNRLSWLPSGRPPRYEDDRRPGRGIPFREASCLFILDDDLDDDAEEVAVPDWSTSILGHATSGYQYAGR